MKRESLEKTEKAKARGRQEGIKKGTSSVNREASCAGVKGKGKKGLKGPSNPSSFTVTQEILVPALQIRRQERRGMWLAPGLSQLRACSLLSRQICCCWTLLPKQMCILY